jgi:hypothetical protein
VISVHLFAGFLYVQPTLVLLLVDLVQSTGVFFNTRIQWHIIVFERTEPLIYLLEFHIPASFDEVI